MSKFRYFGCDGGKKWSYDVRVRIDDSLDVLGIEVPKVRPVGVESSKKDDLCIELAVRGSGDFMSTKLLSGIDPDPISSP